MLTKEDIIRKNKQKRRKYINNDQTNKDNLSPKLKYVKGLISRILLSVIFVMVSIIFINSSEKNREMYKKYIMENSLEFTKINNWYQSLFGRVDLLNKSKDTPVFSDNIKYSNIVYDKNRTELTVGEGSAIKVITSGIVVFIGSKDNLGNTLIIQGKDGVDIWYSNLTDTDISVYDYVESGSVLGTANSDVVYLTISKDGKFLSYEEYQKLV